MWHPSLDLQMLQCIGPTAQKMPLRKDQSCGVTCDVCGAEMKVGDLLPMRAYKPGASHLHKFVAYLSTECARKLLGKQTTTSKLLQKLRAIARHTQVMDLFRQLWAQCSQRMRAKLTSIAEAKCSGGSPRAKQMLPFACPMAASVLPTWSWPCRRPSGRTTMGEPMCVRQVLSRYSPFVWVWCSDTRKASCAQTMQFAAQTLCSC